MIEGDQDTTVALVLVIVIVDAAIHDPLVDVNTIPHLLDEGSPHYLLSILLLITYFVGIIEGTVGVIDGPVPVLLEDIGPLSHSDTGGIHFVLVESQ